MRIRRDIIIQSILKHQNSFFKMLDYINENSGMLEVPDSLYLKFYHNEICPKADREDDSNVKNHLSIETMLESKVFIYHNKNTGNLSLHNQVYELLKFIDVSRAKGLNREDFENLRRHIEETTKHVMGHDLGGEAYRDSMTAFYSVMNETLSKFRSNLEKLTVEVDDVAIEYKAFENNGKVSFIELYEKVRHLYQRYVLPCYEFISPTLQLVSKKTFSEAMDSLIEYHNEASLEATANEVRYSKRAVASYFKDVEVLENKLKQYSNRLEIDRSFFMSVENAFSVLMEDMDKLRHGKQRGFLLSEESNFFLHFNSLDGVSEHRRQQESDFQWEEGRTLMRFKEYLRGLEDIESTNSPSSAKRLKPLPIEFSLEEERKIKVSQVITTYKPESFGEDIHLFLNNELLVHLEDYSLVDVLYGLEAVHSLYGDIIVMTNYQRKQLSDDKYFLNYLPIKVEGVMENV